MAPRMTLQTQMVVQALLRDPSREMYGRELAEETGFRLAVRDFEPPVLVRDGARLVYMRPIRFPQPAAEIVACIERFLQGQDEPELAEILVVKGPEDIASSMPGFAAAYIRHAFA